MMVQNEHWYGQPRPASKLASDWIVRLRCAGGRMRGWLRFERRQVLQVVVDRLQRPVRGVAQDRVHAPFELAGEQAHAHVERDLEVGLQLRQHGEAAGHVEAADHHRHAGGAERARDVERARELVRLHADDAEKTEAAVAAEP